ncbi:MAG: barstar family protein [Clostridiales bacterium]|nr:barstar family protein [Candidatus Scatonaster coprocaballi]
MSLFLLDGKDMISKEAAYEVIAKEMNFPEYFGKNLDALYDCLTDLGSEPVIVFVNTAILEENLGEYGQKILSCFRDAADEYEFTFREKR